MADSDEVPGEDLERAHANALRLLAHRARSVAEMRARLKRHGLRSSVVEAEIQRLTQAGLLNDEEFAREKTGSLLRRGMGPRGVLSRISSSRVEAASARAAVDDAVEAAGGEEALAREALDRKYGDLSGADKRTRAKAANYLVRRGFSSRVAAKVSRVYSDDHS